MTRFKVTGSILNHKRTCRRCAKEKLNEIGATLKPSQRKSLVQSAQKMGVSVSRTQNIIKLLSLHPYKRNMVH